MPGGKASRDKGNRLERELVKILDGARIRGRVLRARRVPLSGAMKDIGFGGDVLVGTACICCSGGGCPNCSGAGAEAGSEERVEVKGRGQGFKRIYKWLEDAYAVAFRGDRKEWIVCIRLEDLLDD